MSEFSIDEQSLQCFDQLETALDHRNMTLDDILKVEIQLYLERVREIRDDIEQRVIALFDEVSTADQEQNQ